MNKKVLVIALALAMLALPMISIVQAKKGGIPTEIFHDLKVGGMILPDDPTEIYPEMQGNMQYAEYAAHCDTVTIRWDFIEGTPQNTMTGSATYVIEYKVNLNTWEAYTIPGSGFCRGVAHIKTIVTLDGGTFEGEMIWVGDLLLMANGAVFSGSNRKWHTFWKGTDAYEGWTIIQNMNSHPTESVENNHLIKPIDM
jgi:hypothetical protein